MSEECKTPTFGLAAIRIAPLICRVVRCGCGVLGLDSQLGTFGFHTQPPIPLDVCTKTNIESDVIAMYSPDKSSRVRLKGIIET